jgi:hypothetical protein
MRRGQQIDQIDHFEQNQPHSQSLNKKEKEDDDGLINHFHPSPQLILILYYHIFNNHAGFVKSTFKKSILLSFCTGFSIGLSSVLSTGRTGLSALPCTFDVFYSRLESSSFSSWMVGALPANMLKIYLTTELFLRKVSSSISRMAVRMLSVMILLML